MLIPPSAEAAKIAISRSKRPSEDKFEMSTYTTPRNAVAVMPVESQYLLAFLMSSAELGLMTT